MKNLKKPVLRKFKKATPYRLKQTHIVKTNALRFIQDCGLENVGFLTLTFPDKVLDWKVGAERFKSLNSKFFPKVFGHWIRVFDRTKKGYVHYHLLVDCKKDIRTGFDFSLYSELLQRKKQRKPHKNIERRVFKSANENLKNLWKILRERLPNYHFGRFELYPIKYEEATAKYFTKYIADAKFNKMDKGVRKIAYSQGQRKSNYKFSWNTPRGKEWRRKLKTFCEILGFENQDKIKEQYGGTWGFLLADIISDIDNIQEKIKTGEYTIKENSIICTQTGEDLLASYREKHESKIQEKQEKFYKIWKNQNIMKNQKDIDQRGILL